MHMHTCGRPHARSPNAGLIHSRYALVESYHRHAHTHTNRCRVKSHLLTHRRPQTQESSCPLGVTSRVSLLAHSFASGILNSGGIPKNQSSRTGENLSRGIERRTEGMNEAERVDGAGWGGGLGAKSYPPPPLARRPFRSRDSAIRRSELICATSGAHREGGGDGDIAE